MRFLKPAGNPVPSACPSCWKPVQPLRRDIGTRPSLPAESWAQEFYQVSICDLGGLKPNTWQRFERLRSAWKQAKLSVGSAPLEPSEREPGVVRTPRRRTRTPLTGRELASIRTARASGESVVSISRRFGIHRMTV